MFPHHKVDEQSNKKAKKELSFPQKKRKRRKNAVPIVRNVLRLARLGNIEFCLWKTVPGKPDAKSLGTNSKSTVQSVNATSSKHPGKQRTIAWKNTSQTSSSVKSLR